MFSVKLALPAVVVTVTVTSVDGGKGEGLEADGASWNAALICVPGPLIVKL